MAPPNRSARVVFSGSMAGGEIWSSGFWVHDLEAGFDQGTAQALALLMDAAAGATDGSGGMYQLLSTAASFLTTWDATTVYLYDGTSNKAAFVGQFTPPARRTGGSQQRMPNQIAMVVSLRSTLPGRRYRGRMYLPAGAVTLDAAAQFPAAVLDPLATAWAHMFSGINASGEGQVVIVSTTGSVATPVSAVVIDSRPDVQRRRANRQAAESRSTVGVVS